MMKKKLLVILLSISFFTMAQSQKTHFIDSANMDFSVKPGDDFYEYANGTWLKNTPMPATETRWGSFQILREESINKLKDLLTDAAQNKNTSTDSLVRKVGKFYAAGMDSAMAEKWGYQPIVADLKAIQNTKDKKALLQQVTQSFTQGNQNFFYFYVGQDAKNVTEYIAQLGQSGLGMPDKDYYSKKDARTLKAQEAYKNYNKILFILAGNDPTIAMKKANEVFNFEKQIAQLHLSRVELRDPVKTYHKIAVAEWSKKMQLLNFKELIPIIVSTKKVDSVVIDNPTFFIGLDSLLVKTPITTLKSYLEAHLLQDYAPYLSNAFVMANFQYNQSISGQKEIQPRYKRMINLTDESIGEMSGKLYVDKYFPAAAKERMMQLINNLQQTFAERINQLSWMSDSTKQQAHNKLNSFTKKIAYPDKFKTYEGLVITDNLVQNIKNVNQWQYFDNLNKLGKPIDKTEWHMTPPTVNAYYNPLQNEIVFPAGILQFPFFDFNADDAINYGGIAAVIGHEMSHGFDDEGSQFDALGNLNNWWTSSDRKLFDSLGQLVVKQFDNFTVLDTIHVNGSLCLGENIADLGGLNMAYVAFKKTPQGQSTEKIDGFTPDQRFFLSWAQVWRQNILPETQARFILIDPHSPTQFRCNGPVVNMQSFYDAFNVTPDQKMYVPIDKRTKIW